MTKVKAKLHGGAMDGLELEVYYPEQERLGFREDGVESEYIRRGPSRDPFLGKITHWDYVAIENLGRALK